MIPGQPDADEHRAALALVAAIADSDRDGVTAILGPGWKSDRHAVMAFKLAGWFADALRRIGWDDPAWIAREAIVTSIAQESTEGESS